MIPVVMVVGYSNSGKTTLVIKLIKELKLRGYRVATIKHHHKDFDIDVPGKDTWRHAEAGADTVVLASPGKVAVVEHTPLPLTLDDVIAKISGVDLIIIEGFKRERKPKIEVFRSAIHTELITPRDELLAVASDVEFSGVPTFALDDSTGLVNLIETEFLLNRTTIPTMSAE